LGEWERFYNFHRPHGAHNGKTPYEALREKLSSETEMSRRYQHLTIPVTASPNRMTTSKLERPSGMICTDVSASRVV